jgi:uncharacterized protein
MSGMEIPVAGVGFEALDAFLSSNDAPPESMQLSDLDGFLTGIAIGPELVMPSEWLPVVWGGEQPVFADGDQAQAVLGAIMSRYNEILRQVEEGSFEPILWIAPDETVIAADWAEGFALAIGLRPEAWEPLLKSKRHAPFLLPILGLGLCGDQNGESALGLNPDAEDELAREALDMIPACVGEIARFWRARRAAARIVTKTGRNDICPCGSGKKFKKCCGQT